MKKNKNLGKLLSKRIDKFGYKKKWIAQLLKISRPTLNERLIDGEFTDEQVADLRTKNYLPEDN